MRKALGKGLDALLSGGIEMPQEGENSLNSGVQKIPLDKIIPNRYQPRKTFNDESLQGLAESIKQHGLTQPVVVVYDAGLDKYELVKLGIVFTLKVYFNVSALSNPVMSVAQILNT